MSYIISLNYRFTFFFHLRSGQNVKINLGAKTQLLNEVFYTNKGSKPLINVNTIKDNKWAFFSVEKNKK